MAAKNNSKKKQSASKYCDGYSDLSSESDSNDSTFADPDWEEESVKRTRGLLKSTQDFAEDPREFRRNVRASEKKPKNSAAASASGGKSKRRGLGESEKDVDEEQPRQCYWIDCINAAIPGSKYCSDECGVKLAELRIKMILPHRIAEWNATPCVATEMNEAEVKKIQAKRAGYKKEFDDLEEQRQSWDKYVLTVSNISYDPMSDPGPGDAGCTEDGMAYCIVCGHEASVKTYLKHIERCIIRTEKAIIFESKTTSDFPGTKLFCDVFNSKNGQYCKRLYVNCPDHSKKVPFPKNAICGAPLVPGQLNLRNICRALKSKCMRHYNWENIRRADIDIQKVVAWTNHEQFFVKESSVSQQMQARGGLLNLLLNSTKVESS